MSKIDVSGAQNCYPLTPTKYCYVFAMSGDLIHRSSGISVNLFAYCMICFLIMPKQNQYDDKGNIKTVMELPVHELHVV